MDNAAVALMLAKGLKTIDIQYEDYLGTLDKEAKLAFLQDMVAVRFAETRKVFPDFPEEAALEVKACEQGCHILFEANEAFLALIEKGARAKGERMANDMVEQIMGLMTGRDQNTQVH